MSASQEKQQEFMRQYRFLTFADTYENREQSIFRKEIGTLLTLVENVSLSDMAQPTASLLEAIEGIRKIWYVKSE